MSIFIFLLFLLVSSSYELYQELHKYGSEEVIPNTKVYINITSYSIGELISLQFGLNFIYEGYNQKEKYSFKIGQVPASTFYDPISWDKLPLVHNKNVTCDSDNFCNYVWEEIKKTGNNYIYILPLEPYDGYYSTRGRKIKISMIEEGKEREKETKKETTSKGSEGGNGLGIGAIVGIILGCIGIISLIISIILYYRICSRKNSYIPVNYSPALDVSYTKPPVIANYSPPVPAQLYNQPIN